MLGTSSSYVSSTLKLPSFVYTFILKAIKKHSLLVALSRIDPNPLVGSEASFLYHAIRARPDPATDRAKSPSGVGGGGPPPIPNVFFFFDHFLIPSQSLLPYFGKRTMKSEGARERTEVKVGRATRPPTPLGYGTSTHHSLPKGQLALRKGFTEVYLRTGQEIRVRKAKQKMIAQLSFRGT
jgi:hypothetical protein